MQLKTEYDNRLKVLTCSHIDYALHEDGEIYCKACHTCSSDIQTYEDQVSKAEELYDALREEGQIYG